MPKQAKEKSPHRQGLEAVFDRHTRRFSPFDILGLRTSEGESLELERTKTDQEEIPTHTSVGGCHTHEPQTHIEVGGTPLPGVGMHTTGVEVQDLTNNGLQYVVGVPPTHMGVDATHPQTIVTAIQSSATPAEVGIHDVFAANQVRAQLGRKARQVLGYLNSIRSLEGPAYTVPVGYAQISAAADV